MSARVPSHLVVRTADGATLQLPSRAILDSWLANGRVDPHDRVLGADGRWYAIAQLGAADGPFPPAATPRIARQRLNTRPLRGPCPGLPAPVRLGAWSE